VKVPKPLRWTASLVLVAGLIALGLEHGVLRVPPGVLGWGTLDLDQPPGAFARMKLNSLASDPEACLAALDRSALEFVRLDPRPLEDGCGLVHGVRFEQSHIPYSSGSDLSCVMAAALYWYEAEVDRLALEHLGSGLARIDHLGTYACRNINGSMAGRRSQHATANAIDIAAFHLRDGRIIDLFTYWNVEGPESGFLKATRDAACGLFNTVLSPDYNALHADHFHLDMGRIHACR